MRWFLLSVLYTALTLGANAALGGTVTPEDLREGSMKKLMFAADPVPVPVVAVTDETGAQRSLAEWRGRVVVVNFWATWCAPCRKELPSLDLLNKDGDKTGYAVVTIATGRNPPAAIRKLFADAGIETLPVLLDPDQNLARGMGVFGLPATVILDRDGREIARMTGEADWSGESARAIIAMLSSSM